ncbi:MAG: NosD domain-containing protein [Hyphomicrobium sp.]|nr:NosD domain-containing protein [Hyphomicrobium sp.]
MSTIIGSTGPDPLNGTADGDTILGLGGQDTINGGAGNDLIVPGSGGSDTINGDAGIDTLVLTGTFASYTVSFLGGNLVLTSGATVETISGVEVIAFDDVIVRVVGTGSEYATVQSGIDAAAVGETVLIAPGIYDEDVQFNKDVTVLGAKFGLAGTGGARDASGGTDEATIVGRSTVSVPGVTIDGLRFLNDATTTGGGPTGPTLFFSSTSGGGDNVVTNSIFWSTVAGGANGVDDRAISSQPIGSGSITISDSLISGTSNGLTTTAAWGRGYWFDGGGVSLTLEDNTFQSTRTAVNLDVAGSSTLTIDGNTIINAGTGFSGGLNFAAVSSGITDTNFQNVGTDFNLRNLTPGFTFDAEVATGTVTPVVPANVAQDFVQVLGGEGSDTLLGTSGSDYLDDNAAGSPFESSTAVDADTLDGRGGDDLLIAEFGNDTLIGGSGNDTLDGGAGTDTANFSGPLSNYTITASGLTTTVTDNVGTDGTDTLTTIEVLNFNGTNVLIVGGSGYATIQAAIDAASPGDTIFITAGTYDEDVQFNKAVTVLGAKYGVAGTGGGRDASGGVGEATIIGRSTVSVPGVTIDGLRFLNDATTTGGGPSGPTLFFSSTSGGGDNVVTNSIFWSTVAGGANGIDDRAISSQPIGSGSITVTDSLISGTSTGLTTTAAWGRGYWFDGGGVSLTLEGNTFQSTRTAVNLDVAGSSTLSIDDNTIINAGTGFSGGINFGLVASGITDTNFENVGTDYNLRNLTTGFTFDAEVATGTVTPVVPANVAQDFVQVLGGEGSDTLLGTAGSDYLDDNAAGNPFESSTAVDADILDGRGGDDLLVAENGNDTITGGSGNDTIQAGSGTDTAKFSGPFSNYTVTASGLTTTVTDNVGTDGTDTLTSVEILDFNGAKVLLVGGSGFATIQAAIDAASPGDTILVAAGTYTEAVSVNKQVTILGANDGISGTGSRGAESILSGGFHILADGVVIDGFRITNGATFTGETTGAFVQADNVTITNTRIEGANVTGTRGIVTDSGRTGLVIDDNYVTDWATGAFINPGTAATVTGNTFEDNTVGLAADGPDGLSINGNTFTNNSLEQIGMGALDAVVDLSSQIGTNTFTGTAPQVSIYPLFSGDQTITGTGANDVLNDLGNAFAQTFFGGGGNDSALGGLGNDILDGGTGNDSLVGGAGNDTYTVDTQSDVVTETSGNGTADAVRTSVSYSLGMTSDVETLETTNVLGTGAINLTGSNIANTLNGNAGANTLDGGAGADMLYGFGGNDIYFVDNAMDNIFEGAAEGTLDIVRSTVNFTLQADDHVERLVTTNPAGTGAINLTGNDFAQEIYGNAGVNILRAFDGNDAVYGLAGADTVNGGLGNDTLAGGADNDVFVFNSVLSASNIDTLLDFSNTGQNDQIFLENTGAGLFTALAAGALAAAAFKANATGTATDADDRIIYNTTTGALIYDTNGNAAGGATQFAILSTKPTLTSADFQII